MGEKQFYVYIYFDPRNNEPFYVGKGHGWRLNRHLKKVVPNKHLKNRIKAIRTSGFEPIVTKVDATSEQEAFQLERELIATLGRRDLGTGPLCNYTAGGDGSSGRVFSHNEQTKEKIRQAMLGREMTDEHRARIGASRKGRVNSAESIAQGAKIRLERLSEETRQKLSEAARKAMTPERQAEMTEKARLKNTGSKNSPETIEKKRLANQRRVVTAQMRENMRIGQLRRQARERGDVGN